MKNITPRKPLSISEKKEYAKASKIIKKGKRQFIEVGFALEKVRDGKLYREEFSTFEAYCQKKWGFTRQYAGRLIDAAEVSKGLPEKCKLSLQNPTHLNELSKAPEAHRNSIAMTVIDEAKKTGKKPTAKLVKAAVEAASAEPEMPEPKDIPDEIQNAPAAKPVPILPALSTAPKNVLFTPARFEIELKALESRVNELCGENQSEREKYGAYANALTARLMNPRKKEFFAYGN